MWREVFFAASAIVLLAIVWLASFFPGLWWLLVIAIPLILVGLYDITQTRHNVLRNYPIVGHLRYMLLGIRPQIQQYFVESEYDGRPFSKEKRNLIYHRARSQVDTLPFGTIMDVYADGYESARHSLSPKEPEPSEATILVGGEECKQPYHASRLNISAMSFGALSKNAIRALNRGAKLGGFAHNTGEGGLSPYHLMEGGDVTWQIGTGYFGCRTKDGNFDSGLFRDKSQHDSVKMIEIKLSQGAKPAHGGILPGVKVSQEIADIRGLEVGKDAISPPAHTAFSTPIGLLEYVQELRELSGGKPVGFKLCVGQRGEFFSICKAMLESKIYPDFITVDGAEGGTGAAPVEFTDRLGLPLEDGLAFVVNALVGTGLRDKMRVICSGKVTTGFDMLSKFAQGADMCNAARAMMFSLGCIQSRRCHTNECPTGIATQDEKRMYAVDIDVKAPMVARYHAETIKSFLAVLGATGRERVEQLKPATIRRRISPEVSKGFDEIYQYLESGILLTDDIPPYYKPYWDEASAEAFNSI